MLNKILATTLAASLAFTAPASAKDISQDDALGALMFGIVTGLILNEMKGDKPKHPHKETKPTSRHNGNAGSVTPHDSHPSSRSQRYDDRSERYENPTSRRGYQESKRQLPRLCTKRVVTKKGTLWITEDRCLDDMNVRTQLPHSCRVHIKGSRNQVHTGYSPSCLEKHGYNIGR